MGTTTIHQLQIPMEGYYTTDDHYCNLGSVLLPDLTSNSAVLNDFIFTYDGSEEQYTYTSSSTSDSTNDVQ